MTEDHIGSFAVFWPHYLGAHRRAACRALHYLGTCLGLVCLGVAALDSDPWWLLWALFSGYGAAWIGHFFVEHNRPATFRYPLWSLRADLKMLGLALRGKMATELTRLQVSSISSAGSSLAGDDTAQAPSKSRSRVDPEL